MKIGFIFVLYKTPKEEVKRLKSEIGLLGFEDYRLYFIDNTQNNRGYAAGVNEGIRRAVKDGVDLFVVANPDISLAKLSKEALDAVFFAPVGVLAPLRPSQVAQNRHLRILEAAKHFDIWGYAMKQNNKLYYGGKIDRWQMSGGLISNKPKQRFLKTNFVSGSLMFIKKEVIEKIGLFDESYFMYYEDVDYCYRARKAGFKVGIDSAIIYEHFEKSSNNPQKDKLLAESHQKFFEKYGNIWQKIYKRIKQSRFLINFFSLNLSSFLNKLLHFILFLFLIRYLTPSQYGVYVIVWAHIGLLSTLLDFGTTSYGLVYLPLQSQKNIFHLFSLRLLLSFIVFILTIFLAIFFRYQSQTLLFIVLTSFVIFSSSFSGSFLILSSVKEKIYLSSLVSLFFNFFLISGLIAGLIFFKSLLFIFLINFIAYNLYSLINLFLISKEIGRFRFYINIALWSKILKKSIIFLLISFLANLYFKLDVFLLNFFKGSSTVGLYSSGYKFLEASLIIASSYNITSLPILSKLQKENLSLFINKIKKDLFFLGLIGLCVAVLFYFIGPILLPIVLPGKYWQSIKILQILILALPFILITSVFLNSIYALGKAHLVIFIFLFQTIFNFSLNYFLIPQYSYFASAYITLLGEILNMLISFIFLKSLIRSS